MAMSPTLLQQAACPALELVNPFVGTGGLAFAYGSITPAAQVPFGALRLGPDTTSSLGDFPDRHFSGYHWEDDLVRAFSHTHLMGAGVNDLGNVGIMPLRLDGNTSFGDWAENGGFGSPTRGDDAPREEADNASMADEDDVPPDPVDDPDDEENIDLFAEA